MRDSDMNPFPFPLLPFGEWSVSVCDGLHGTAGALLSAGGVGGCHESTHGKLNSAMNECQASGACVLSTVTRRPSGRADVFAGAIARASMKRRHVRLWRYGAHGRLWTAYGTAAATQREHSANAARNGFSTRGQMAPVKPLDAPKGLRVPIPCTRIAKTAAPSGRDGMTFRVVECYCCAQKTLRKAALLYAGLPAQYNSLTRPMGSSRRLTNRQEYHKPFVTFSTTRRQPEK